MDNHLKNKTESLERSVDKLIINQNLLMIEVNALKNSIDDTFMKLLNEGDNAQQKVNYLYDKLQSSYQILEELSDKLSYPAEFFHFLFDYRQNLQSELLALGETMESIREKQKA